MTKYLILMRHANASNVAEVDLKRELTPQGISRVAEQCEKFKKTGIKPELILTSHATRARQTAQLVSTAFYNVKITEWPELYDDLTTHDFLRLVKTINPELNAVVLVGHNPTMSMVASRLLGKNLGFEPANMAVLSFNGVWLNAEPGMFKLEDWF